MYGHLSRLTVTDKLKRYSRYPSDGQPYMTNTQSCSKWGLHGIPCYQDIGELLPRLSILTKQTLCGLFLLHCPGSHLRLTLSGTLSYAARTFLIALYEPRDRITNSNQFNYTTSFVKLHLFFHKKQIFLVNYSKPQSESFLSFQ